MSNNNNNEVDNNELQGIFLPLDWLTVEPPEHEFCINPLAPIGSVTLMVAHGGTGKSLLSLYIAIHVALGVSILNTSINACNVAYMSLEDPPSILRNRLYKITKNLSTEIQGRLRELTEKLMFIDRYGNPTYMAFLTQGQITESEIVDELINLIKQNEVKCLFVDTLIRTNALNENDNAQMGALLVLFEKIAVEAECAVILLHHLPKGTDNKQYAARGASAITDNARSSMLLEKVTKANDFSEEDIKKAITDGRFVRIVHTKHNYSSKHPDQYFEIDSNGVPIERVPTLDDRDNMKARYLELQAWFVIERHEAITRTKIDESVQIIREEGTTYGKAIYKKALEWGIDNGYVEKVPAPKGGSKNSNAEYYVLHPIV